jgi:beta-aspartyl-peptidase (threonine type)
MPRYAILVHGGCGHWDRADVAAALKGVRAAAQAGRRILADGGSALDAVCAAVVALEDNPLFNAGTGSALNRDGDCEMDASVMCGEGLRCGGVTAIRRVRNPVLVARRVMEETSHVLLAADGALAFARSCEFADYDPITVARRERHRKLALAACASAGTVGAVARDTAGRFAAATSTGGVTLKMPGRVGDSPIAGAGNYATKYGAASATGNGELMMRTLATKSVCDLLASGKTARAAARAAVSALPMTSSQSGGVIALDAASRIGAAVRGGAMPHAWFVAGDARLGARMQP